MTQHNIDRYQVRRRNQILGMIEVVEMPDNLFASVNDIFSHIQQWLDKHGIQVEEYDICGGCESYVNPLASSKRIIQAIEEFEPLPIKDAKGYPYEVEN